MATLNIKIPAISDSFYTAPQVPQVKDSIEGIQGKYGSVVNNIAKISNIPSDLLYSFIFIESAGNATAVNKGSGATGLMQIAPKSATEIIYKEIKLGRLSHEEEAILIKYIGADKLKKIRKMKQGANEFYITQSDLLKPELNVLVGAIFLGILLDEESKAGGARLDKVVIRYNKGYYYASRGRDIIGDIGTVLKNLSGETAAYIKKLLGKNGTLDILTA